LEAILPVVLAPAMVTMEEVPTATVVVMMEVIVVVGMV
jgi:hypothetical protein